MFTYHFSNNMKQLLGLFVGALCGMVALMGCGDDDALKEYETHKGEYTVYYYVTYSTTYDFHNIVWVSYTDFFDYRSDKTRYQYSGKPVQLERRIDGTKDCVVADRVPKGAHVEFSTYVDVEEALPNTKVEVSIEISQKGGGWPYTEVAKASAGCPLRGAPLTIGYDVPDE